MFKYKCVFLDLDDTLCNFTLAKDNAKKLINVLLTENNILSNEFWLHYNKNEKFLMQNFLNSKISINEYRYRRYMDILDILKVENSHSLVEKFNEIFMNEINFNITFFKDVVHFLTNLRSDKIEIAIVTNGPSDGQRNKIQSLKLKNYTNNIFISEEVGFSKPDIRMFQFALNGLNLAQNEVIMIGDNLEQDYLGAENAKIDSILLDRFNKYPDKTNINKVNNLDEVYIKCQK